MDDFQSLKETLIAINGEVAALINQAETLIGNTGAAFAQWQQSCDTIARQLKEHIVRVGVVGAIKSGKSTFVNTLLKDDYLKRGAGVVTSIVTRIRKGEDQGAKLFFKSWDEINEEIEQALVLFPTDQWQPEQQRFDIRRQKDRDALGQALASLDAGLRVTQDQLNANGVLLSSYLKGYDRVHPMVGPENEIKHFDAREFGEHREYVSSDALAVYLKDLELQIPGDTLTGNVEIADCQGSDSPNPLHLAMIQDYLLKTHLIIYVISSRTGVRQADIRFLSMIKQMGIAENIVFICNCDLNEHDGRQDLEKLIGRMKEELGLIIPDPRIFSFSALFHLFETCEDQLPDRDRERLQVWRHAESLISFSSEEHERFWQELHRKLTREHSMLLLKNQLERLGVILSGLEQWVRLNREFQRRDAGEARKLIDGIQGHLSHILQIESMVQSTLNGAIQKKKKEIKQRIDHFFDRYSGSIVKNTIAFVRSYDARAGGYQEMLVASGFAQTLYMAFQRFKQALDAFMAENVNPDIIGFIGREEKELRHYFKTVADPYEAMVKNALMQYEASLAQFGMPSMVDYWDQDVTPDFESIKQSIGLVLQPASASLRYSGRIKTEAVAKLGFYSLTKMVRKLLKKPLGQEKGEEIKALEDGIRRTKRETERSLLDHFKDYQENIKFQYMFRLVDAAGQRLHENLVGHFRGYLSDLKALIRNIDDQSGDKAQLDQALGAVEQTACAIKDNLSRLRADLLQLHNGNQEGEAVASGR